MKARAVTWIASPPRKVWPDGPVAWITSLSDPSTAALRTLHPNASDIDDGRDRTGVDRRRFVARRALLRVLIAGKIGIDPETVVVRYGEAGRPLVEAPGPALFCSISARGDIAGLAISTRPVGIDLEVVQAGAIPWAVLTSREIDHLKPLPEPARMHAFLQIWTLKEAYLKAVGTGLNRDPSTIDIASSPNGPVIADGRVSRRLHPSTFREVALDGQPFLAACVEKE